MQSADKTLPGSENKLMERGIPIKRVKTGTNNQGILHL